MFLLRRSAYVYVTMRLYERDAPDFFANRPRHLFVEQLETGLKETDELGRTVLEVVDIERYRSNNIYHDVIVTMKVKSTYNARTKQHAYNGAPMLIGAYRSFRLQDIVLSGVLVDIAQTQETRPRQAFLVTAYLDPVYHEGNTYQGYLDNDGAVAHGVKSYIADALQPGMTIVDEEGTTMVELTQVRKTAGEISFATDAGYQSLVDPTRTQVGLTMRILAEQINDAFYYQKDGLLIVNGTLQLDFDSIHIAPTIMSIEPMASPETHSL